MKEISNRLPTRAAVLAGVAALAVSMVAGTSAQAATTKAPTSTHSVLVSPRSVNPAALPKAGTGVARHPLVRRHSRTTRSAQTAGASSSTQAASPRALTADSSQGFAGDSYDQQTAAYPGSPTSDQAVVPPDNGTAVGTSFVVEFLNSSGWVYLRNNGGAGPVFSWDLNTFFVSPADQTAGFFESDPRIVWDPTSSRWFASSLAFSCIDAQCTMLDSREYVAVSSSADPTQIWTVYTVFSDQRDMPSNLGLGDQPRMGVTSDKVVEFWDYYENSASSAIVPEGGVVVDKGELVAGATATVQDMPLDTSGQSFGEVPAYDSPASDAWLVFNNTDGNLNSGCSQSSPGDCYFGVVKISGAAGSATVTTTHLDYGGNPTFYLPSSCSPPPNLVTSCDLQAPQPGANGAPSSTAPWLDANDDRITIAAIHGSTLWATANTACGANETNPVCVRMFKVTVGATPTLDQNVNITGPSGASVYFGAPAFDSSGNVTVGMTESSTTLSPSLAISGELTTDASFSAPVTVATQGTGAGKYDDTADGFVPPDCVVGGPGSGQPCRWGDYSGNQPDVCDPTFTWASQEYAAPPTSAGTTNNWGTWLLPLTFSGAASPANCMGAPTVTAVSPSSGASGCVNLTGTGFTGAQHVYIGSAAASFGINSDTAITANVPSGPTGTVHISVVNASGDSLPVTADQFTYTASGVAKCVPTVTSVTPDTGPLGGENGVVVHGSGFISGTTTVSVNGSSATVTNTTPTAITVNMPAEPAGMYDVRASNGGSQSPVNPGDVFTYVDGGYTMNAYGSIYPFGNVQAPPVPTDGPSWPGWKIARAMVVRPDRGSGYVLDGFGGIHLFGGAPAATGGPYWGGWDIARDIALDPCDTAHKSGWVLDGFGGLHPFGGAAAITGNPYWGGWDVARKIVMNSCGHGGYEMDAFGGLHPFSTAAAAPAVTDNPYWPNWMVAAGIVLTGDGKGYEVDDFGGVHAFGGAPAATNYPYYNGWYIITGVAEVPGVGGYTLDAFGGVHPFSSAPSVTSGGYSGGSYIFRDIG